jgi:sorbitol/mannitol transport system substrate-binding protein
MKYVRPFSKLLLATSTLLLSHSLFAATEVTIGTVNNADMVRMQQLSSTFTDTHPDIKLNWVLLEENVLRQRLTTDIATKSGQFDVVTIGAYETPIWGNKGWLTAINDLPAAYQLDDIFPNVRAALTVKDKLFALPFYGESSVTFYRKDWFAERKLTMPKQPTWSQIVEFAKALHAPDKHQYGICLRGKAGWGENMALITTIANSFGARWFDEKWQPEFTGDEWKQATHFYANLLSQYGPPGASSNGFNENLALFNQGQCAMWVDASVAGSFVTDSKQSKVADQVGFALAPSEVTNKGASWLWVWALAIPVSSDAKTAAQQFITWATSPEYSALVAKQFGVSQQPPGVRQSTYTPEYLQQAPFAAITLEATQAADFKASLKPKPYEGIQYVAIPEFQAIATYVGKLMAGILVDPKSADAKLQQAQTYTLREMQRAGYDKK